MKTCPVCGRLYPVEAGFCPEDGQSLSSVTQAPTPTDATDPLVGQVILSRYQPRRVVADGGMGRVYEALDMSERRSVAIKILHAEVARDEIQVERFKREFEVSKMLDHAHIVEVLDFKPTTDNSYALVMEFLYGEELRATLKRESVLPPARVLRMLSQLAIGLDDAHDRKLVHRDLKPDNVFLCQTREGDIVKVLDFGSVKDKGDGAKQLTVLGTTIGSPFYMAPEQAQGLDTLDHRADVWALAAICYECLTGQVPFKGSNGPNILLQIITKDPEPASVTGEARGVRLPKSVDRALIKAFVKDPVQRTPSIGQLADDLGHALGLAGDHRRWASMPQSEIEQHIERALPELLANPDASGLAESFFGDGAFGDSERPPKPTPTVPQTVRQPVVQSAAPVVAGLDRRPVWPWLAALGAAFVIGALWLLML